MKKTVSEQEIHARLRQLADGARRVRDELSAVRRQPVVGNAVPETRTPAPRGARVKKDKP